jgi:hypothetical protein
MIENRVVSWPPCCVPEDVNAPPTFPLRLLRDFLWHGLRHALHVHMRAGLTRPLRDSIGHRFDVTVC